MARLRGTSRVPSARSAYNQKSPPITGFSSAGIKSWMVRKEITIDKNNAAKVASKYRMIVIHQKSTTLV
jgi:hypothetical protein